MYIHSSCTYCDVYLSMYVQECLPICICVYNYMYLPTYTNLRTGCLTNVLPDVVKDTFISCTQVFDKKEINWMSIWGFKNAVYH